MQVFELLTGGDYLFDPASGSRYSKDDDHIAQIMELLGEFPKKVAFSGKYSHEYFNRKGAQPPLSFILFQLPILDTGELRHIAKLRFWPLTQVLREKYILPPDQVDLISGFLLPMLKLDAEKRISARDALKSGWLEGVAEWFTPPETHGHTVQYTHMKRVTEGKENAHSDAGGGLRRRSFVNGGTEIEGVLIPVTEADAMKPADGEVPDTEDMGSQERDRKEREARELREMMYGRAAFGISQGPGHSNATTGGTTSGGGGGKKHQGGGGGGGGSKKKYGKK